MNNKNKLVKLVVLTLCGGLLLSFYSYLYDIIYDISKALSKANEIVVYLLLYIVWRSWNIFVLIILYDQLFKYANQKFYIILKILFVVFVSSVLAVYYGKDDWSITIAMERNSKYIPVYCLSGLSLWIVNELFKHRLKNLSRTSSTVGAL